jgi:pyruvate/2-oxoglutarate dehydrogenase complex dihydrolipoamide acyltransferase (E2) component
MSPPTEKEQKPQKAWYLRWWVWLIAAVVVIGVIANIIDGGKSATDATSQASPEASVPAEGAGEASATPPVETEPSAQTDATNQNAEFEARFARVCAALNQVATTSSGTVTCQDADTWQQNHEKNPDAFPHEYRDVNFDFGDGSAEIKVVAEASTLQYFKAENTCENIYGPGGSCAVGEVGSNIVYSVHSPEKANQEHVDTMAAELQKLLSAIP